MRVKLDDVPLSRKLWLTVAGLLLALLVVTQWTQARLRAADEAAAQRLAQQQEIVSLVSAWVTASLGSTNASMAALASSEPAVVKLMQERLQAARSAGDEMETRVQQSVTTDADHRAMAEIIQRRNAVKDLLKQGVALKAHDAAAVPDFIAAQLWPAVQARQAAMQALLDVQSRERDAVKAAAEAERQRVIRGGLLSVTLVAGLSLLWTGFLLRSIHRPLQAAVELAEAVAAGNLAQGAAESRGDEIGRLLQAMSEMAGRLRLVVTDVRSGVGSVATASAQIAAGNLDLSHRTESTAGNLQQTVASLEQLSGTVAQTADVAQQASELAEAAAQSAQRGGAVAAEVVGSMDRIAEAARRIADITGVIDAIAFQTNILALNAAVEAARAGEQGRGFAVVAGEVRTLAQRSATAAREIKQLIAHSGEAVADGARQVGQSREVMAEIVAKVGNVSTLIGEMARASDQGRVGIRQVSEAVDAIDRMTQQNAALVEQSSAAAVSLRDQAARLSDAVAVFRVEAQLA